MRKVQTPEKKVEWIQMAQEDCARSLGPGESLISLVIVIIGGIDSAAPRSLGELVSELRHFRLDPIGPILDLRHGLAALIARPSSLAYAVSKPNTLRPLRCSNCCHHLAQIAQDTFLIPRLSESANSLLIHSSYWRRLISPRLLTDGLSWGCSH